MDPLHIEATDKTPQVYFDAESGRFEIIGKSIPQEAESFYAPVLDWMEEYVATQPNKTKVIFKLDYFNISSSKRILFMLYKLNDLVDNGKDVSVTWHYADSDEDMKEVGEDFAFMVRVPFEFIRYQSKKELVNV